MGKTYDAFLLDLDGTVYRGKEEIPEAVTFVKELKRRGLRYLFVTNNSTRTKETVAGQLQGFGIPCTANDVLTTSMATARYIKKQKADASVYYIGEAGLKQAMDQERLHYQEDHPDFVAFGMDRQITYEKYTKACLAVRAGARFVSTNPDVALPNERGLVPGNGSLTSVIRVSTGVSPIYIGKPESIIVEQALEKTGTTKERTLMIGDNYDTDIMAGIRAGLDTLIVLTGVTSPDALKKKKIQPTYTLRSLSEWKF
ncbi:TIGR01457 family HAD-type hydrolase [Sporolactobacillus sp. Y61]|uniref:TIGR01457 family HAD-type hydrolase n=1 Tax=Sporolactobacillus sp. Y61 TaxID=3160863 RepID=A0AAU8IC61_9BACL|nr:TIGR01457 family HAD-type hydrolase [Sporolactobacillus sp. THM19-2]RYL93529.1 TIGR01457 family HAD-type hydrolase [Sporolactobacillus sp. THM19-2]